MAAFEYPDVLVRRWVDGDTVDLRVTLTHDFGFRFRYAFSYDDRFRLAGVDTPERGRPGWAEATAECARLAPPGSLVFVRTFKDDRDKFGRWLAEIFVDGLNLNRHLVASGFAKNYGQP